jgi:hypothetical protein
MTNPYIDMLTKGLTDALGPLALLVPLLLFGALMNALVPKRRRRGGRRPQQWRRYHEPRPQGGRPAGWRGAWSPNGAGSAPRHDTVPLGPGLQAALATGSRMPDAADQLRIVMASEFKAKRLLNRGESRVLAALEPLVAELLPGWRVCAQVSLGEVLEGNSTEAFNTINAKRVDFLLVDETMRPRHAIEYQGQGHHQGAAAARDAVKKEALRKAGVGYGEVFADDTPAELRAMIGRLSVRQVGAGECEPAGAVPLQRRSDILRSVPTSRRP